MKIVALLCFPAVVRSKLKDGGEEVKFPVVDFDGRKSGGHIPDEVWTLDSSVLFEQSLGSSLR